MLPHFKASSYALTEYTPARNYINGQWCDPTGGQVESVINPRHGKAITEVHYAAPADIDAAVAAAKAALPAWQAMPIRERAQIMYRARELMMRDLEYLESRLL